MGTTLASAGDEAPSARSSSEDGLRGRTGCIDRPSAEITPVIFSTPATASASTSPRPDASTSPTASERRFVRSAVRGLFTSWTTDAIASEAVARRILDHPGLGATGPPLARAQAPDDLLDPAPGHDVVDPATPIELAGVHTARAP